jgi:predicted ATPase/DNA-binding winged helix-turn-helix (wHTH) protein
MEGLASGAVGRSASFDGHTYDLIAGRLVRGNEDVRIGSRAAALLTLLLSRAGQDIDKAEISNAVWPGLTVEEVNIRVQVAALRKALGDQGKPPRFISNVAGRGYRWIAATRFGDEPEQAVAPSELIGRSDTLAEIYRAVLTNRLTTLTGAGGIGKTSLAREALSRHDRSHSCHFVDLAAIRSGDDVADAIRRALGAKAVSPDPILSVAAAIGSGPTIIVLDNCEHVIAGARDVVAQLLGHRESLTVLATSREALGLELEAELKIGPLEFPQPGDRAGTDAETLASHSAVELFIARLRDVAPARRLDHRGLLRTASICRQLGGVPLAIRLVASRAADADLDALSRDLGDWLSLPSAGPETGRHETLKAAIEWSYRLLLPREQRLLRAASAFRADFDLNDLRVIDPDADPATAERLVEKSIFERADDRYRLLETTRAFAQGVVGSEVTLLRNGHAKAILSLFPVEIDWQSAPDRRLLSRTDDVRAALDWSFDGGDPAVGIALLARSAPLWFAQLLLFEYRDRLERVIAGGVSGDEHEVQLCTAFAVASFSTGGSLDRIIEISSHARDLAARAGADRLELRNLWALCGLLIFAGRLPAAMAQAERYEVVAKRTGDQELIDSADRMLARTYGYLGRNQAARRHADRCMATSAAIVGRSIFQLDQRIMALGNFGRVAWTQGQPDEAVAAIREMVDECVAVDHVPTSCLALAESACMTFLWAGAMEDARHSIDLLKDIAARYSLTRWQDWAQRYEEGYDLLDPEQWEAPVFRRYWKPPSLSHALHCATVHPALVTNEAVAHADTAEADTFTSEILRGAAEQIMGVNPDRKALEEAQALLARSLDLTRAQGALSLELRTTMSIARLKTLDGRASEGRDDVEAVLGRFKEGFGTMDLRRAARILA